MPEPRLTFLIDAKNVASKEFASVKRDLLGVESQAVKAGGGISGFAKSLGPAKLALIGFGVAGAGLAVVAPFIGDSIKAASDLNETLSKSQVVFGDSARIVEAFGDKSARSLGISKQAAVEAAATFGNLFVGLDLGQTAAADMSTELVTLAGDLASFNNLDPTVVLEKLRSGLAGEAEPLRSLGVFLNEAKVKAKAMELGLADAHGELTEGAKVQARYALILEETTTAQGDFGRTASGLANKQRISNAVLKDAQAVLGQKLLPAQLALTDAMIAATPVITGVAEAIGAVAGATEAAIGPVSFFFDTINDPLDDREKTEALLDRYAMRLDAIAAAGKRGAEGTQDLRRATGPLGRSVKDLTEDVEDLADEQADLEYWFGRTARAASEQDDALARLSGEMFSTEILTGDLAQAQKDLAEKLAAGPETEKAEDIAIWRGEIAAARKDVFDLQAQLAQQAGPQAFYDWLVLQEQALGNADAALLEYIRNLKWLTLIQGGGTTPEQPAPLVPRTGAPQPFAHGGPYRGGEPILVGERGPEILLPKGPGEIIPNTMLGGNDGTSMGGGGTPVSIPIYLDGRVIAEVVDEHLYYRRAAAGAR